jgi:hypothetical protein
MADIEYPSKFVIQGIIVIEIRIVPIQRMPDRRL